MDWRQDAQDITMTEKDLERQVVDFGQTIAGATQLD
jgi:hypothetical protein